MVIRGRRARDGEAVSVDCLVGAHWCGVDASGAPHSWGFAFDGGYSITAAGTWRLVVNGRIRVSGKDHDQMFGLPEPVDARLRLADGVEGASVRLVRFDAVTGDLRLEFDNEATLEILTDSCGYESWSLNRPDGTGLVAIGGGEVLPFGPDEAG